MTKTISGQLLTFAIIVIVGLVTSVGSQFYTLRQLRVNGPIYQDIIEGKNLLTESTLVYAEITEAYMLANEMFAHSTLADKNTQKISTLQKKFTEQVALWEKQDLNPEIKTQLEEDVLVKSTEFWSIIQDQFIPAYKSNEEIFVEIALGTMLASYQAIQESVATLVDVANTTLTNSEKDAAAKEMKLMIFASLVTLISIIVIIIGMFMFRRRAITPLGNIKNYMNILRSGDSKIDVPFTQRDDEIGEIAKSLEHFRQAAIDRDNIQAQSDNQRRQKAVQDADLKEQHTKTEVERNQVIQKLTDGLISVSRGDLSYRINERFAAEFEELRAAFNQSIDTLSGTLAEVSNATYSVRSRVEVVSKSSDDLSKRTEQQAASLEQTATALGQVTSNVLDSTKQASLAQNMAADTKNGAEKSGVVVRNAIEAMTKIEESAQQINQIISVMDEIAFQTNLLALNAGVEAARAGEAGRGFAVVAQEVRELAQRSAKAAKEIKGLIDTSSGHVETGVSLVNETGVSLEKIEQRASEVNDIIVSIVAVSNEQSIALAEINTSVGLMDKVTQQNATMVQETNLSCDGLMELSSKLESYIQRFRLAGQHNNAPMNHSIQNYQPQIPQAQHMNSAPLQPVGNLQLREVDNTYVPVQPQSMSPARSLGRRLAGSFNDGNQTQNQAQNQVNLDNWDEF